MLISTNHWIKSDNDNETTNLIPLINDSDTSQQEFQPIWISLPLIISKSISRFNVSNK
jgi:hypothetical protein